MRRLRTLAVGMLLGCLASVGGAPSVAVAQLSPLETTRFTKKNTKAGDRSLQRTRMDMDLTVKVANRSIHTHGTKDEHKVQTVLKVDGDAIPIRLKVHYLRNRSDNTTGGQIKKEKEPTEGKTYILEKRGDETVVKYPKGGIPPQEEIDAVRKDYGRFGKPDRFFEAIPSRRLKPGERVPEMEKALAETFADSSERPSSIEDVRVVFKGREGKLGRFDVALVMAMSEGPMNMRMPLKGTLKLRVADGWVDTIDMAGPIEVTPTPNARLAVSGKGKVRIVTTASYP